MVNTLGSKFAERTTEQLKSDAKAAFRCTEKEAILVFVLALNELETRLSDKEYRDFENSIHDTN